MVNKLYTLPKNGLLRKRNSFQAVYRVGKSFANRQLVIYVTPNPTGGRRVGFAAGKRLGNAVVRNRIKRLLREAYRLHQHRLISGVDLILVGRQALINQNLATAVEAFVRLSARAGVLVE